MRLARPVLNEHGLVLLNEGLMLTEELIEKLKTMGLDTINVKGVSRLTQTKAEMLTVLDERFRRVESEPFMKLIKDLIKEHIESLYEKD